MTAAGDHWAAVRSIPTAIALPVAALFLGRLLTACLVAAWQGLVSGKIRPSRESRGHRQSLNGVRSGSPPKHTVGVTLALMTGTAGGLRPGQIVRRRP